MTALSRQVGQLLWVGFDGLEPPDDLRARIGAGEVGAALVFARNIFSREQLVALTASLHAHAPASLPLLVCVDQEGGRVQRVRAPATVWPPMLRLGERAARSASDATSATALAEAVGTAIGRELAALGFDLDFAPVLDVHTNPGNPIIGDRAFATTPELVVRLAGAFSRGLQSAGILPCGKHYPGHGDTHLDSHLALPLLNHPMERLRTVELYPFRELAHLPTMMTAHVVYGALHPALPATLCPSALTLLRNELGFSGVIVSDDLEMKAITAHFAIDDAVVRGLLAGCDVFLLCHDAKHQRRAFEALVRAAERRSDVRTRLATAAACIESLKRNHFNHKPPPPDPSVLGCAEHARLAELMLAGAAHFPMQNDENT